MKRLRIEPETLCRAVAPKLNGRPLYVVPASDMYADPGNGDGPDGCTMRHLNLMLRPTPERRGRWSGRGPPMVLDPRSIARTAERRIRPARRRVFARAALGGAIHELAHVLTGELPEEVATRPARAAVATLTPQPKPRATCRYGGFWWRGGANDSNRHGGCSRDGRQARSGGRTRRAPARAFAGPSWRVFFLMPAGTVADHD